MVMHALIYFDNPKGLPSGELLGVFLNRIEEVMGEAVTVVSGVAIAMLLRAEGVVSPVIGMDIHALGAMDKLGDVDVVMLKFGNYDNLENVLLLRRECSRTGKPIIVEGW